MRTFAFVYAMTAIVAVAWFFAFCVKSVSVDVEGLRARIEGDVVPNLTTKDIEI